MLQNLVLYSYHQQVLKLCCVNINVLNVMTHLKIYFVAQKSGTPAKVVPSMSRKKTVLLKATGPVNKQSSSKVLDVYHLHMCNY